MHQCPGSSPRQTSCGQGRGTPSQGQHFRHNVAGAQTPLWQLHAGQLALLSKARLHVKCCILGMMHAMRRLASTHTRRIHTLGTMALGHCLRHALQGTVAQALASLRTRPRVSNMGSFAQGHQPDQYLDSTPRIRGRSYVCVGPSADDLSVVHVCDTNFLPPVADPVAASAVVVDIPADMPFVVVWARTVRRRGLQYCPA